MSRIAFLTHSAAPSGAELSLIEMLHARDASADVLVIFSERGVVEERLAADGVQTLVLPIDRALTTARRGAGVRSQWRLLPSMLKHAHRLRIELRRQGVEVVVARSLKAALYGRLATIGTSWTFVWSVHDRLSPEYLGKSFRFWSHGVSWLADALVVNSLSTLETLRTYGKPVMVLPPSVATRALTPPPGGGHLRLLCLGRLAPWKGQDVALCAFADSMRGTGATLRVVGGALFGEDDFALDLRRLATALDIDDQVKFVGHLDDPSAEIEMCDVLVHCSRLPEPFGRVVLEGMLAGRVVIATEPGGPAEVITPGVTGVLAAAGSVASLSRAMRLVAAMPPEERRQMGSAARARGQAYNPHALCAQHLAWLDQLASGVHVPPVTMAVAP